MDSSINKRWYDIDPTVSLAVSFIRNLSGEEQVKVAGKILEKGRALGIKINESRIILTRRWYDENPDLSSAIEYLKQASPDDRRIIALDVIDFLTTIK